MAKSSLLRLITLTAALLVLAGGLTVALARNPARVAPGPNVDPVIQREVDAYLVANPGGRQINATEIAYDDGAFVVTVVPEAGILGVPDCPSGWFCFYDGINYGYPRGKLSDCGWQDLGWWGWRNRTESVHYNMASGSVTFINETGSVDTSLFSVDTVHRTISDVYPNRNKADYVYRFC
jgi:hypothetical protein